MTSVKSVQSVFRNPTRHALTRNIHVLRKIIRVIRVQKPYASRLNKDIHVPRKIIRVIREIRVQKPYASRINKE